jgi:hypothetical protein
VGRRGEEWRGYVYTTHAAGGRVLYVGSTVDIDSGLSQHGRGSEWWSQATDIEVLECTTIAEARAVENDRICRLDPPFNVRGGHASLDLRCAGRRCARRRAAAALRGRLGNHLRVRRSRRRCAPPLQEWDVARAEGMDQFARTPIESDVVDVAPEVVNEHPIQPENVRKAGGREIAQREHCERAGAQARVSRTTRPPDGGQPDNRHESRTTTGCRGREHRRREDSRMRRQSRGHLAMRRGEGTGNGATRRCPTLPNAPASALANPGRLSHRPFGRRQQAP